MWGSVTYVATARDGRYIGVGGTLVEAKVIVEGDHDAQPYFGDKMDWTEGALLPPVEGHQYSRRTWIGKVVTDPHDSPAEFVVIEQCIEHLPTAMGAAWEFTGYDSTEVH